MYKLLMIPALVFVLVLLCISISDTNKAIDRLQNHSVCLGGGTTWDCNPSDGKLNCQLMFVQGYCVKRKYRIF